MEQKDGKRKNLHASEFKDYGKQNSLMLSQDLFHSESEFLTCKNEMFNVYLYVHFSCLFVFFPARIQFLTASQFSESEFLIMIANKKRLNTSVLRSSEKKKKNHFGKNRIDTSFF